MLGAHFIIFNVILLEESEVFFGERSLFSLVALIDEAVYAVLGRVLLCLFYPESGEVLERFWIGNIIGYNDCISPFVIGLSNSSKSLLAGGVPNLQFNIVIINIDRST